MIRTILFRNFRFPEIALEQDVTFQYESNRSFLCALSEKAAAPKVSPTGSAPSTMPPSIGDGRDQKSRPETFQVASWLDV